MKKCRKIEEQFFAFCMKKKVYKQTKRKTSDNYLTDDVVVNLTKDAMKISFFFQPT